MTDIPLAKALSSSLNWRILDLLMNNDMSEAQAAKTLGESLKVVRAQLERLESAGLVIARPKETAPSKVQVYSLTRKAKSVGYPPRGYQNLSESIIVKLVESMGQEGARMILRDIGFEIGEDIGRNLISMTKTTKWDPQIYSDEFVNRFLADMGTYPKLRTVRKSELVYEQSNCLFQELADKMPGLICDTLDEGVHEGLDKILAVKTTRSACRGHGDPACVFCVKLEESKNRRGKGSG